jgi:hypothetical protein
MKFQRTGNRKRLLNVRGTTPWKSPSLTINAYKMQRKHKKK